MRRLRLLALLILSGCSSHYGSLKAQNPQAADYTTALASEYLSFAESEAEMKYWSHADLFGRKGQQALTGQAVEPEQPGNWDIDPLLTQTLETRRGELMAVLGSDIERTVPQRAAHTQVLYDCWVVQAARDAKIGNAYTCQVEFESALAELQTPVSMPSLKTTAKGGKK